MSCLACGHDRDRHGPEAGGCIECRCRMDPQPCPRDGSPCAAICGARDVCQRIAGDGEGGAA